MMTTLFQILAILLVVSVVVYGWNRNDLRRLTRDFARSDPFHGTVERCLVRFPLDETSTDCTLGTDSKGLYMSSPIEALEKTTLWSFRYHVIRTPVFIPWNSIQIRDARFPMQGYLRFDVPSNKATFFVPRETGRLLLANVDPFQQIDSPTGE